MKWFEREKRFCRKCEHCMLATLEETYLFTGCVREIKETVCFANNYSGSRSDLVYCSKKNKRGKCRDFQGKEDSR